MKANAWHHRVEEAVSSTARAGVGRSILGVKSFDPIAGILVPGMILDTGIETGYRSILELADAAIPSQKLVDDPSS